MAYDLLNPLRLRIKKGKNIYNFYRPAKYFLSFYDDGLVSYGYNGYYSYYNNTLPDPCEKSDTNDYENTKVITCGVDPIVYAYCETRIDDSNWYCHGSMDVKVLSGGYIAYSYAKVYGDCSAGGQDNDYIELGVRFAMPRMSFTIDANLYTWLDSSISNYTCGMRMYFQSDSSYELYSSDSPGELNTTITFDYNGEDDTFTISGSGITTTTASAGSSGFSSYLELSIVLISFDSFNESPGMEARMYLSNFTILDKDNFPLEVV